MVRKIGRLSVDSDGLETREIGDWRRSLNTNLIASNCESKRSANEFKHNANRFRMAINNRTGSADRTKMAATENENIRLAYSSDSKSKWKSKQRSQSVGKKQDDGEGRGEEEKKSG